MHADKTLFAQIMDFLPWTTFQTTKCCAELRTLTGHVRLYHNHRLHLLLVVVVHLASGAVGAVRQEHAMTFASAPGNLVPNTRLLPSAYLGPYGEVEIMNFDREDPDARMDLGPSH